MLWSCRTYFCFLRNTGKLDKKLVSCIGENHQKPVKHSTTICSMWYDVCNVANHIPIRYAKGEGNLSAQPSPSALVDCHYYASILRDGGLSGKAEQGISGTGLGGNAWKQAIRRAIAASAAASLLCLRRA
jgi:hypothetical protein